jgi:ketosteroid isomerase-like protein
MEASKTVPADQMVSIRAADLHEVRELAHRLINQVHATRWASKQVEYLAEQYMVAAAVEACGKAASKTGDKLAEHLEFMLDYVQNEAAQEAAK